MLFAVACTGACRWFSVRQLTEAERREIATQFRKTIARAGGVQIWIKDASSPRRAETPIEMLALPPAYETVLAAIRGKGEQKGLQTQIRLALSSDRRRSADIRILSRGELVIRWRLREVPRICRAAIVIDDLGQDLEAARRVFELPYPLTCSVLPWLPHSARTAEEAHQAAREIMLHLPMQPERSSQTAAGKGELKVGMSRVEVARIIQTDLRSVPHAVGVNNHMGSQATTDAPLMDAAMRVLADCRLYFVDSRTTPDSVALGAARRAGVPACFRSVFLDDIQRVDYTLGQLRQFRRVTEEQGAALAIGHPYPTTLAALARFLPELEKYDIQLVPVSQLVQLPETSSLSPLHPSAGN